MAIRIRMVDDYVVALCAAETDPKCGDIYLDDDAHHALSTKFGLDWYSEGFLEDPMSDKELVARMESQKVRGADTEESAPAVQAAPSVPDAVIAWHAAEKARIDAVYAYNARLQFVKEHCPFGTSVNPEYQAMEEARRKAFGLLGPMFDAISAYIAADPSAPSVPDTVQEIKPMPNRREHELKVWPEFYEALHSGEKTFELRKDDRGFRAGDVLWLREWNMRSRTYSGREMRRLVTYIISGNWGLEKDIVCMALAAPSADAADQMDIDREGARFWHRNCANHLGGVMKVIKDEPTQSLIQCLHCGKSGYYPVGGVGRIRAAIAVQSKGRE